MIGSDPPPTPTDQVRIFFSNTLIQQNMAASYGHDGTGPDRAKVDMVNYHIVARANNLFQMACQYRSDYAAIILGFVDARSQLYEYLRDNPDTVCPSSGLFNSTGDWENQTTPTRTITLQPLPAADPTVDLNAPGPLVTHNYEFEFVPDSSGQQPGYGIWLIRGTR
jgi:hypothetical protein